MTIYYILLEPIGAKNYYAPLITTAIKEVAIEIQKELKGFIMEKKICLN
jgi:hypothetical protein